MNEQKQIIVDAEKSVALRKVHADQIKIDWDNGSKKTLDELLIVVDFEDYVFNAVDRTDTESCDVILEFTRTNGLYDILDGFDYEVHGDKYFVTELEVSHV